MGVDLKLELKLTGKYTKLYDLGGNAHTGELAVRLARALSLITGTAAGQGDRFFCDRRTISASSNDDLDLSGALVDVFGDACVLAKVKGVIIVSDPANANNLVIGNPSNPFIGPFGAGTHTHSVRPGGFYGWGVGQADATAFAVTAGTGDIYRVANGGGGTAVIYDIAILGTSA